MGGCLKTSSLLIGIVIGFVLLPKITVGIIGVIILKNIFFK